jgi:hypothetical protein
MRNYASTPVTPEEFESAAQARILKAAEGRIIDSLGSPLSTDSPFQGTFSNRAPAPPFGFGDIVDTARKLETMAFAARPRRFAFGDVSVAGFWISIEKVECVALEDGDAKLVITSIVPDRNSGRPIGISFTKQIKRSAWEAGSAACAEIIRQMLREWLWHEIDEHIFINGVRARDPHKQGPLTIADLRFP